MRNSMMFLFLVVILSGCATMSYQGDLADNQFDQKQRHADAQANYVGEWTAPFKKGLRSIKIREDGKVKICLSPSAGTEIAKVYLEDGRPAIITESGVKVDIIAADTDHLLLNVYGREDKYYAASVPDACKPVFRLFR